MRCEEIREELVSFVLGELSEEENEAIRGHVESCERCAAEVAQYRQTLLALGRWKVPAHGQPPNFAFLPAPPVPGERLPGRRRRLRIYAPALVAAFFLVLFVAAFYLGTHVRYDGGALTVTIGQLKPVSATVDSAMIAAIADSVHRQDMRLVSGLIAASEARQAEMYRAGLASVSQQLDDKQQMYINYLMNHIYKLQQQDRIAYYQSQAALDGVVKLANAVR